MRPPLDGEQFRPGYPGLQRLRVLRERHQAILGSMHNRDRDCNLFQWVGGGACHRDDLFRPGQPTCHPIERAHQQRREERPRVRIPHRARPQDRVDDRRASGPPQVSLHSLRIMATNAGQRANSFMS